MKIANKEAGHYVTNKREFAGSNLWSHWVTPTRYVVFSYDLHWPLYIYDADLDVWFANADESSRSTNRHAQLARPIGVELRTLGNDGMLDVVRHGGVGLIPSE